MKTTLEQHLLDELKKNEGVWIKKVSLYVFADELGYSPETVGRLLRDLAESGTIKVSYYDGKYSKHLAKYSYKPPAKTTPKITYKEENGIRIAVLTP